MARSPRNQPRVNGKFASDPDNPPKKPSPPRQNQNLAALRKIAMRLAGHLKAMMPPEEPKPRRKGSAPKAVQPPEKPAEPPKPLSPAYDRLLGKADGIVDAFATLAQVVVRIVDQERQGGDARAAPADQPYDEEALDRRIAAELDRIAARRRAGGGDPPARPDPGGQAPPR